jgi:hypothetical protein
MWAYYNDGVSFRNCGGPEQLEVGELFFAETPTEEQLIEVFPNHLEAKRQMINNQNKQFRANAYKEESDPLFFEAQRGESTMEEWLAKVNEIKNRWSDI